MMQAKTFTDAITARVRDAVTARLEELDFDDIMNDVVEELIRDEVDTVRDAVFEEMCKQARNDVCYEADIREAISEAVESHCYYV